MNSLNSNLEALSLSEYSLDYDQATSQQKIALEDGPPIHWTPSLKCVWGSKLKEKVIEISAAEIHNQLLSINRSASFLFDQMHVCEGSTRNFTSNVLTAHVSFIVSFGKRRYSLPGGFINARSDRRQFERECTIFISGEKTSKSIFPIYDAYQKALNDSLEEKDEFSCSTINMVNFGILKSLCKDGSQAKNVYSNLFKNKTGRHTEEILLASMLNNISSIASILTSKCLGLEVEKGESLKPKLNAVLVDICSKYAICAKWAGAAQGSCQELLQSESGYGNLSKELEKKVAPLFRFPKKGTQTVFRVSVYKGKNKVKEDLRKNIFSRGFNLKAIINTRRILSIQKSEQRDKIWEDLKPPYIDSYSVESSAFAMVDDESGKFYLDQEKFRNFLEGYWSLLVMMMFEASDLNAEAAQIMKKFSDGNVFAANFHIGNWYFLNNKYSDALRYYKKVFEFFETRESFNLNMEIDGADELMEKKMMLREEFEVELFSRYLECLYNCVKSESEIDEYLKPFNDAIEMMNEDEKLRTIPILFSHNPIENEGLKLIIWKRAKEYGMQILGDLSSLKGAKLSPPRAQTSSDKK